MRKYARLTSARLKEILRRQDPPKWGADYEPAIRAVREEAPPQSRPSEVWSNKLGRYCHSLSLVEQKVMIFALYHPRLFELQEQRMLATEARPHPLAGHPSAVGMLLPPLKGSIDVCERLDMIDRHPVIRVSHPQSLERITIPFPFTGDFLLFLTDGRGPYCINWTVKGEAQEFQRSIHKRVRINSDDTDVAVRARHAIEDRYYLDAGIRTVRIVNRDIPAQLADNLRSLIPPTSTPRSRASRSTAT